MSGIYPKALFLLLTSEAFNETKLKNEVKIMRERWGYDFWASATDDRGDNFAMAALKTSNTSIIIPAAALSIGYLHEEDIVEFFKLASAAYLDKDFWASFFSELSCEDDWVHFCVNDLGFISDYVRSTYDRSLCTTLAALKANIDVVIFSRLHQVISDYDFPDVDVIAEKMQNYLARCLVTACCIPSSETVLTALVKHLEDTCSQGVTEEDLLTTPIQSSPTSPGGQEIKSNTTTLLHELVTTGCNYALNLCLKAQPDFDISSIGPKWSVDDSIEPLTPIQIAMVKGNIEVC